MAAVRQARGALCIHKSPLWPRCFIEDGDALEFASEELKKDREACAKLCQGVSSWSFLDSELPPGGPGCCAEQRFCPENGAQLSTSRSGNASRGILPAPALSWMSYHFAKQRSVKSQGIINIEAPWSKAGWHAPGVFVSTWNSEADGLPKVSSGLSGSPKFAQSVSPLDGATFFPRSPSNSVR